MSRKQIFAGSMVLFIAVFYLIVVVSNRLQQSSGVGITGWREIKFLLLGIFYAAASILFFLRKTAGWVLCFASLLNVAMIALVFLVNISQSGALDVSGIMSIFFFILLFMATFFMLQRNTRQTFQVNNLAYLSMIGVYGVLLTLTYIL